MLILAITLLKKVAFCRLLKKGPMQAPEILRNEDYSAVRRNKPAPFLTRGGMRGAVATGKEQLSARPREGERAG